MVLAFLLAALTLQHLIHDRRGAWFCHCHRLLAGNVNAFDVPIRQIVFVNMVGEADLPNAIALNSSIFNGARVVGPAIAGFSISLIGEGWCFFSVKWIEFPRGDRRGSRDAIAPQEEAFGKTFSVESLLQGFRFA